MLSFRQHLFEAYDEGEDDSPQALIKKVSKGGSYGLKEYAADRLRQGMGSMKVISKELADAGHTTNAASLSKMMWTMRSAEREQGIEPTIPTAKMGRGVTARNELFPLFDQGKSVDDILNLTAGRHSRGKVHVYKTYWKQGRTNSSQKLNKDVVENLSST